MNSILKRQLFFCNIEISFYTKFQHRKNTCIINYNKCKREFRTLVGKLIKIQ